MPRKALLLFLVLVMAALALSARVRAQDAPAAAAAPSPESSYTVTFYDENDFFAGTDEHYTNAFHISALSKDLPAYAQDPFIRDHAPWLVPLIEQAPLVNDKSQGLTHNVGFSIGNQIYTPTDTRERALLTNDRPYAGYSYAAIALHAKNATTLDTLETSIGMVGPSAGGKYVQDSWHQLINKFRSKGWHNQIKDEPTLGMSWQHSDRPLRVDLGDRWAWDAIPHYGLVLGNAMTYANAGGQLRIGRRLPHDFGVSLISPGAIVGAPGAEDDPQLTGDTGYNLFLGTDARAIARNIFLDGNTWQESHSVNKKPFVVDVYAGASLYWQGWTFTYTHVYRSREYNEQKDGQFFGSFSVGHTF